MVGRTKKINIALARGVKEREIECGASELERTWNISCQEEMADFDAIYEEQELAEPEDLDEAHVQMVPDPIVIRGAGNMTV